MDEASAEETMLFSRLEGRGARNSPICATTGILPVLAPFGTLKSSTVTAALVVADAP
jgi:hypothetical protein